MKNQNIVFIAIAFALAFALAPVTKAAPNPGGIPSGSPPAATASAANAPAATASSTGPDAVEFPMVSIHSAGNILRGKTGSFVLAMAQSTSSATGSATGSNPYHPYVNFSVSGTAIPGVDYVALVSPTLIGASGYGVILVKTLPDPRGGFSRQAYSVVVTLEPGLGYALGGVTSRSALIWIKPSMGPSDW
jgi:hypothetical protein